MLQIKNPILYFFLLVFEFSLNLSLNASYKQGRLFEILPKKGLKFFSNKKNSIVAPNLSFVLLPEEINPVPKKQKHKKNVFMACSSGYVEIILILLTKALVLYMQVFIIQVHILGLKGSILKGKVCLAIFLVLNK